MSMDRSSYVGGSDVAAILGHSPYLSPYQVWCRKLGLPTDDAGDREAMHWGTTMEPLLIAEWQRRGNGTVLAYPGPELRHPTKPHLGGHVDGAGVTVEDSLLTILEGKTVSEHVFRNQWVQADGEVRPPLHYRIQGQWYLHVWNEAARIAGDELYGAAPVQVHFPVLVGGNQFLVYGDTYRPDLGARLEAAADDFWTRVQTRTVPDDFQPGDNLALLWPEEQAGRTADLPEDLWLEWQNLDARLRDLNGQTKELEALKDGLALRVQAIMQEAETGRFPNGQTCTWNLKNGTRKGYVVEGKVGRGFRWPVVRARKGA